MTIQAHPQITPNDFSKHPKELKDQLPLKMHNVYSKVWSQAAATLCPEPILNVNQLSIKMNEQLYLTSSAFCISEEGWLRYDPAPMKTLKEVAVESYSNIKSCNDHSLMKISDFSVVSYQRQYDQHFSYATLIDEMERANIAGPSTYASAIQKLVDSNAYVSHHNKKLSLSEKGQKVLGYLDELGENKLDAHYSAILEENLDKIEEGSRKGSEVIKNSLEMLFPDIFSASSPTWIDALIGDEPEIINTNTIIAIQDQKKSSIPFDLVDVKNKLPASHPLAKIKSFIDNELEAIFGKNSLNASINSKLRIIKAMVYQSLLNIPSLERYLLELKYNFLLKWLIGLEVENEIWGMCYYKQCLSDVEYYKPMQDIIEMILKDKEMLSCIEALKLKVVRP